MHEYESFEQVPSHLWRYAQDQDFLVAAALDAKLFLEERAAEIGIDVHLVQARPKTLSSYRKKSEKEDDGGKPKYSDPASEIHDCVAARVIAYTMRARKDLAEAIAGSCDYQEWKNPGEEKRNGYDSDHIVITGIKKSEDRRHHANLVNFLDKYKGLEIQVRTVAGHAWAEYEHETRYKPGAYLELTTDDQGRVDQYFIEAGGMRRHMDLIFDEIEEFLHPQEIGDTHQADAPVATVDEPAPEASNRTLLDIASLAELIADRFPANEPGDERSVGVLVEQLTVLGITAVGQLESALSALEEDEVTRLMDYPHAPTRVRMLDDELLYIFLDRYVEATDDVDRQQVLRLRLRRVRGRYTIYSLEGPAGAQRPVAAARLVRNLVKMIAERAGPEVVFVDGVISANQSDVSQGWMPREVKTSAGPVYVATNLNRNYAEQLMGELIKRIPGSGVRVMRAGDLIVEAPPVPPIRSGP